MPKPYLHIERNQTWTNKHQNVSGKVAAYYDVWNRWEDQSTDPIAWRPGIAGLQHAIRDAEAAHASVRAFGGSWSLSSAAYCPDFMLNTKPLNAMDVGISAPNLVAGVDGERLLFAQCGATVQEVHDTLARHNLALKTSGASDGQTLGGAISTGTHGAAHQVGGMQDSVVGIHLLTEHGTPHWLERASQPLVAPRFLDLIDTPGINHHKDDDLFDASLVAFGSFGIIHAYLLETEPLYSLEAYSRRMDYSRAVHALETLDVSSLGLPDGPALPFHFEIAFNPYRLGAGEGGAFVRFMYKRPGGTPDPTTPLPGGHRPGDDLLGVIGTLSDAISGAIPTLVGKIMELELPAYEGVRATPGYTFGPTSIRGRGMSTEMGFELANIRRAVEIIADVANAYPFGGVVAVRYVKRSRALLAFTQYEPTCTIEIQAVDGARSREAYERIWAKLEDESIPFSFHWGQVLPYKPAHYRYIYGAKLDRWLAAKSRLLTPAGRKLFSNDLVRGVGLE